MWGSAIAASSRGHQWAEAGELQLLCEPSSFALGGTCFVAEDSVFISFEDLFFFGVLDLRG